jgi:hypothetical protein
MNSISAASRCMQTWMLPQQGGGPRFEAKPQTSCKFRLGLLILALIAVTTMPGCISGRGMIAFHRRDPMAGAPRLRNASNPQLEDLVTHLNDNTNRIQSWRANNVEIHANHFSLSGTLAVEKGNHVRLVVSSPMGNEVDMGSNDERFWIWSRLSRASMKTWMPHGSNSESRLNRRG